MAGSTEEGKVKFKIKSILKAAPECYFHMPVQNGMGAPTLDFVGCSRGRYFTIEAKKPGGQPTERQINTMKEVTDAGGRVFLIDGTDSPGVTSYIILDAWLRYG
jgi:hypothetical protein